MAAEHDIVEGAVPFNITSSVLTRPGATDSMTEDTFKKTEVESPRGQVIRTIEAASTSLAQ